MAEQHEPKGPVHRRVPPGDDRERMVCDECGFVDYVNPKIVVGVVASWGERYLMCRRAIEPRRGFWTIPAGYMEEGESAEAGAAREAWEEARARLEIDRLLAVYSVPRISQVQLMYRARLLTDQVEAGPESLEVGLFTWDELPWEDLAFPTVKWALEHHRQVSGRDDFSAFSNPSGESANLQSFVSRLSTASD
ncbi:MAG: NUDIX hydrolase [Myxococcota bacterium]